MTVPLHHEPEKRWPRYVFGGRMRMSTVALIVAFLAIWWLYETYQPSPPPPAPATQVVPPGFVPDPEYTWVPRTKVRTPTTTTPTTTTTETTTPTETTSPTETTETSPGTEPTPESPDTSAPPTPLPPGATPQTTAENRSGTPTPTTSAPMPAPVPSPSPTPQQSPR